MSVRITNAIVKNAGVSGQDYFIWDSNLTGFGLKVCAGGRKTYVFKYRNGKGRGARTRRLTIGPHGSPWSADSARREAFGLLASVTMGNDPAEEIRQQKRNMTIADLCDLYLAEGVATKKPSTLLTDRGRIERHIKPLLGSVSLLSVTCADVERAIQSIAEGKTAADFKTGLRGRVRVRGGKGTATRTIGLLGGIFSFAVRRGLMSSNPTQGVKRFPDRRNERFVQSSELHELGEILRSAEKEGMNIFALSIIRLLLLTGARRGEIEKLQWSEVDLDHRFLRLGDSKTGQKRIMLNDAAIAVLKSLPKLETSPFVFPSTRSVGYYQGTPKVWSKIRSQSGLSDVRLHDLRHTFASIAVSGGASIPVIGSLLGQKNATTTARYAHLIDDPVRSVNDRVGKVVVGAMGQ